MVVYFAGAIRGDTKYQEYNKKIIELITSMGHTALSEINEEFSTKLPLTDKELFKRDIKWLESSKALVAEISGASIGVGFEVSYALYKLKLPVLALVNSRIERASAMITGCDSKLLEIKTYSNNEDLKKIISDFIQKIKE